MEFFTNGYALLVGVGADMPVTVKDAQALYGVLVDPSLAAYPNGNVTLLTEKEANRENILNALDQLVLTAQNNPEATVSIYFSGHGGFRRESGEYFLVPYGYDRTNHATTSISGQEFTEKINAIQSQKLILWLDCCHAGGMLEKTLGETFVKSPPPPDIMATLSTGSGRVVVASSKKDQVSYVGEPYSIFTACLLDALKGKANTNPNDDYVRICEVLAYLFREVPERAKPKLQNPIAPQIEDLSDNFPLCYYPRKIISDGVVKTPPLDPRDIQVQKDRLDSRYQELNVLTRHVNSLRMANYNTDSETKKIDLENAINQKEEQIKNIEEEIKKIKKSLEEK